MTSPGAGFSEALDVVFHTLAYHEKACQNTSDTLSRGNCNPDQVPSGYVHRVRNEHMQAKKLV
jgi:hypothetical protein